MGDISVSSLLVCFPNLTINPATIPDIFPKWSGFLKQFLTNNLPNARWFPELNYHWSLNEKYLLCLIVVYLLKLFSHRFYTHLRLFESVSVRVSNGWYQICLPNFIRFTNFRIQILFRKTQNWKIYNFQLCVTISWSDSLVIFCNTDVKIPACFQQKLLWLWIGFHQGGPSSLLRSELFSSRAKSDLFQIRFCGDLVSNFQDQICSPVFASHSNKVS